MAKEQKKTDDKNYKTTIDFSVKNNSHTRTFHMVQDHCNDKKCKILDAGCAAGFLGEAIKDYGHEVWGIEMTADAAEAARQRLDKVFHGTIEDFLGSHEFANEKFDYVLFGDVLEHLVDPLSILKNVTDRLTQNGAIVASIPNVAHIAVRAMLLEGKWEYAEYGILDDTHLRFFTRNSIIELFNKANLEIKCLSSIDLPAELTGIPVTPSTLSKATEIADDDEQNAFQYVVLANKPSSKLVQNSNHLTSNCERILCILHNTDWSVGRIRILDPLNSLCLYFGAYTRVVQMGQQTNEDVEWADTIIFQRESNPYMLNLLIDLKNKGKKIILDIDDLLTEVPEFLSPHEYLESIKPYLEETFRMVDAITVTTPRLQKQLEKYNKNIHVVPNCAYTDYQHTNHSNSSTGVTLLIGSTDTVQIDFVVPTLKKLKDTYKDKLQIYAIGPPAQRLKNLGIKVKAFPIMAHDEFKKLLSTLNDTIGIIPLDDSIFSNCKSAIKFLDYSLAKIPSICSNVPPYSDVIINGETGILCDNNEDAWHNQISALLESPEKRKIIATNARDFTRDNYSMFHSASCWHAALNNTSVGQGKSTTELAQANGEGIENIPTDTSVTNLKLQSMKAKSLLKLASTMSNYSKAYYILRTEGMTGVKNRIKRFL